MVNAYIFPVLLATLRGMEASDHGFVSQHAMIVNMD